MDDRGDAQSIAKLFLGLIVGAVMVWILNLVTSPIFEQARQSSSDPVASSGTQYLSAGVEFFPVFILFLSFFGLIAYSVFVREVVGR